MFGRNTTAGDQKQLCQECQKFSHMALNITEKSRERAAMQLPETSTKFNAAHVLSFPSIPDTAIAARKDRVSSNGLQKFSSEGNRTDGCSMPNQRSKSGRKTVSSSSYKPESPESRPVDRSASQGTIRSAISGRTVSGSSDSVFEPPVVPNDDDSRRYINIVVSPAEQHSVLPRSKQNSENVPPVDDGSNTHKQSSSTKVESRTWLHSNDPPLQERHGKKKLSLNYEHSLLSAERPAAMFDNWEPQ